MRQTINLYTTSGCHLCEQVEAMIAYLFESAPLLKAKFDILLVEIANDDDLMMRYGERIPVLSHCNSELGWPFELDELALWLKNKQ